ncbi:MAG: transglycosylase SLT domain-containing protein [Gemmatimonadaceae bacterium]|nr:transglycosylase SLT domain-containing protein [Gemmatimonadaceae bacterium]
MRFTLPPVRVPRASLLTAVVAIVSACRSHPTPVAAPAPTPASSAPAPTKPVTTPASAPRQDPATRDEVVKTAVSVFGDSAVVAVADSMNPEEPVWDLDVRSYETHDRVEYYVDLFTNRARERFVQRLSRGTRYEPMIRAKLRASGMPEDLTYLALIESGYDPHAYSRAAAVGMWQFMSSTARDVGLRVDWWMDERRDPARATDGAIRFIGFLQKQFGSYYLAAAAYNGGPGRVSRGLTRFADELEGKEGEDRFFALAEQDYLRAETKNYVPQLIAAALVAKMPGKYGIQLDSLPLYAYDSVEVAPGTSLQALAAASGLAGSDLKELNPAILRGVTPPEGRVWLRVPTGHAEAVQTAMTAADARSLRGWETVEVAGSTTTAAGFAERHGVTLKQLRWYNPALKTTKKGRLVAGQTVRVPNRESIALARELPDPSIERYGPNGGASLSARGVHVVRRGESLGSIARKYGLTEARLRSLNGLKGSRVLAGQTLVIRSGKRPASKVTMNTKSAKASASKKKSSKSGAKSSSRSATSKSKANSTSKSKATSKKAPTKKKR